MTDSKRLQQLDLNLLKVFQALYVEQNMTRTADVLHLTPSAVSHAIKRLRETLGDPLFIRSHNKMLPTPACQRMAPLIIDNLTRLQQILQQWGQFEPISSEHHFRIGMHDALEPSIIPQLAQLFAQHAPNVSFSSVKVARANLARELSVGHVDLAIDIAMPIRPPVKHQALLESEFAVVMRKDHPLRNKLSIENYLSANHISVSNRPSGMTAEDILFQERGYVRQTTIRCQNYLAAREIVKNSNKLLTLPKLMGNRLLDEDLVFQDIPFDIPTFSTHIYWHEHGQHDAALAWLRSLFIEKIDLKHF